MAYVPMILLFVAAASALPQQTQNQVGAFQCPNRDGYYPDPFQCDKYWECFDGIGKEKLCPDGLVFPTYGNRRHERCDFPFNVQCEDRHDLQSAQATRLCPRANGFFAHEDATVCDVFYQCVGGKATETPCPGGLHFDEFSGICAWPDPTYSQGCGDKTLVLEDGFRCDNKNITGIEQINSVTLNNIQYPHPQDCQLYYVCLNGKVPRLSGCSAPLVYNANTQQCDDPANVPECASWYDPVDYVDEPQVSTRN